MSRGAVTILYEDQRGPRQGFALHALVKACVFDAINGERRWIEEEALKDYRPLKGDGNLLRTCREEIDLIAADGRSVVAVFDDDHVRQLLKLPQNATPNRVEEEIKKWCVAPDRLFVILLERNIESVVEAASACDPTLDRDRVARALRKDLLERDAIFMELSRERARPTRECILSKLPSLKRLVAVVCNRLTAPGSPPPAPPEAPRKRERRRSAGK